MAFQPIAEPKEFAGCRAERVDVLVASPAPSGCTHAGRHRVSMHIQPSDAFHLAFHRPLLPDVTATWRSFSLSNLLSVLDGNSAGCTKLPRQTICGLRCTK
jgi:hypothetical protein